MVRSHEATRQRILANARRGYQLARADAAYRQRVVARLAPSLVREPRDLWEAVDWIWAMALDLAQAQGPLAQPIANAAVVLRQLLGGDGTAIERWSQAVSDGLSLGSTLRSHPFADQSSWLLRKMSLAS